MNYPKSNVIRIQEGDRGHRTKETKERTSYAPSLTHLKIPSGLSKAARRYWKAYVDKYCISESEIPIFTYLCELHDEIECLKDELKGTGRTFLKVSVDGAGVEHQEPKTHPLWTQLMKLRQEKRILERDFSRRYSGSAKKDEMEEMIE